MNKDKSLCDTVSVSDCLSLDERGNRLHGIYPAGINGGRLHPLASMPWPFAPLPSRRLPPPGRQPAAGELADVEAAPARRCSPACLCAQHPHSSSASARRPLASSQSRVASSSSSPPCMY